MGDADLGQEKKPSGCGLLVLYNTVFRRQPPPSPPPPPPRRSSSASSAATSAPPHGKLKHSYSNRRTTGSDEDSLLAPAIAPPPPHPLNSNIAAGGRAEMQLRRASPPSVSIANGKGGIGAGKRGQGMPSSLVRMQSNGLTAELDSIINDHQRSKGSSTLVRASSGNVMLFGNLGNIRVPGAAILQKQNQNRYTNTDVEKQKEEAAGEMSRALSVRYEPEELKEMGNEEYKKGRYTEAITLYDRAIVMNPHVASYYSNKAAALIALGHLLDAVSVCKEAVKIDPSYSRAHHRLGTLYLRLGDTEKAIRHFKLSGGEATTEDISRAQDLRTHISKCNEARKLHDWQTMLQQAELAVSAGADAAPQVFASQAEALVRLHRHEEAESALIDSPRFDIGALTKFYGAACNGYQLSVQAQVDMAAGRFEEAVATSQCASRVDPSSREVSAVARKALAVASARAKGNDLFKVLKYKEALLAYGEGLNHDAENAILLCNRAACRSKLGQWEKAIEDCNSALNLRPTYNKARRRRADCYTKLERWGESIQDYEVLLQETPADEEVSKALSEALARLKKPQCEETRDTPTKDDVILVTSTTDFRQKVISHGSIVVLFFIKSNELSKHILTFTEKLCKGYPSIVFLKVDVEENEEIAKLEGLNAVPAFRMYKNGAGVRDFEGCDFERVESFLRSFIN